MSKLVYYHRILDAKKFIANAVNNQFSKLKNNGKEKYSFISKQ